MQRKPIYSFNSITHGIGRGRRLGCDRRHLVLVCLYVSGDLSLQVLDVTVEGPDEPQQALPLLLQVVDVGASVVQLSLQTVELLSHTRPELRARERRRVLGNRSSSALHPHIDV